MANKRNVIVFHLIDHLFKIITNDSEESDQDLLDIIEESDDEMELEYSSEYFNNPVRRERPVQRLQNDVEEVMPDYTENEFQSHFRMNRLTFNFILDTIKASLIRQTSGCKMLSPEKQLLITIWKMTTTDSYRSICHKFNVSFATALLSVRRVTAALIKIAPNFIIWPNEEGMVKISNEFAATSGFPNVIGAIGGTHINIPKPREHPKSYVNGGGHYSIQLQAVCDAEGKFTHCYAGNIGSIHDAQAFRLSEVSDYLHDPQKFPDNCHLVGDAAYPLHKHLLTPYRDNGHLSKRQENYNFCHSSARIAIERAFGLLKNRFRSLLTVLDIHRTDLIPEFIIACCVVHNMCLLTKHELLTDEDIEESDKNYNMYNVTQNSGVSAEGVDQRNIICEELPLRSV